MAIGSLQIIESDFHHDHRLDVANVPVIFNRVLEEKLSELRDFRVGHSRIRLPDIHQPARGFDPMQIHDLWSPGVSRDKVEARSLANHSGGHTAGAALDRSLVSTITLAAAQITASCSVNRCRPDSGRVS